MSILTFNNDNKDYATYMKQLTLKPTLCRLLGPLALAAILTSCSMMHDELPECATRPKTKATVNFVYDYNTDDTDHFSEQIGAVTLYVFDSDNHLVTHIEKTANSHSLAQPGFSIPLELPYGKYTLYASARENKDGYEASLLTEGAKFRRSALSNNTLYDNIIYTLDHNNGIVEHKNQLLEHFWLTRQPITLELTEAPMPAEGEPQPDDITVTATVALQRVTNNLHINILRGEDRTTRAAQSISTDDYDVWIETADGRDRYYLSGTPSQDALKLTYNAINTAVATTTDGEPCIAADFSTSRLFHKGETEKHDRLYVKSHTSGEIFDFDLPEYLAKGKEAYAHKGWSEQEYLDRQYDYNFKVVFNEFDDGWRFIEISVSQLSWAKRIQYEEV